MICRFDCLTNLFNLDPEPSLIFAYTLDTNLVYGFIGIAILLLCSALVSGAEVALFSLSQTELMKRRKETLQRKNYIRATGRPKKIIGDTSVANNFINIGVVILFSFFLWVVICFLL
jgi:Mg2+/Co2+ transporter CorB